MLFDDYTHADLKSSPGPDALDDRLSRTFAAEAERHRIAAQRFEAARLRRRRAVILAILFGGTKTAPGIRERELSNALDCTDQALDLLAVECAA